MRDSHLEVLSVYLWLMLILAVFALRGATCRVCSCGGHLLLWLIRFHLLAQEKGSDAWSYLLQRAD